MELSYTVYMTNSVCVHHCFLAAADAEPVRQRSADKNERGAQNIKPSRPVERSPPPQKRSPRQANDISAEDFMPVSKVHQQYFHVISNMLSFQQLLAGRIQSWPYYCSFSVSFNSQ